MSSTKIHPNSLKNLEKRKLFSATNQPKKRRKPSKLKKYIKDNNLTASDVSNCVKYLLPLTAEELKNVYQDEKIPMIVKMMAASLIKDISTGSIDNLLALLARAFGNPKEIREVATMNFNANFNYSEMSEDDAKQMFIDKMNEIKNEGK